MLKSDVLFTRVNGFNPCIFIMLAVLIFMAMTLLAVILFSKVFLISLSTIGSSFGSKLITKSGIILNNGMSSFASPGFNNRDGIPPSKVILRLFRLIFDLNDLCFQLIFDLTNLYFEPILDLHDLCFQLIFDISDLCF